MVHPQSKSIWHSNPRYTVEKNMIDMGFPKLSMQINNKKGQGVRQDVFYPDTVLTSLQYK